MDVKGCGPLDSKLWTIGNNPKEQEIHDKRPFAGNEGRFLTGKLLDCGVSITDLYRDYIVPTRPPDNKFFLLETTNPAYIKESLGNLKRRIKECKPNLVLGLGAIPLKYLGERKDVDSWRGHVVWSEELQCKMLFTYDPAFCVRQRFFEKNMFPGQAETLFLQDIQKAIAESKTHDLTFPPYTLKTGPSATEAISFLRKVKDEGLPFSYDIETVGGFYVDCISICNSPAYSMSIPLAIRFSDKVLPYYKSRSDQAEVLYAIQELLTSDLPKIAQNSQYDNLILWTYYNIYVQNVIWDTMVMAHELYSELPKDLGTLQSLYANLPYMKHLGKESGSESHWTYNAMDSLSAYHIYLGQLKVAEERGVLSHYLTIPHLAIRPLNAMQFTGVAVNQELRQQALDQETGFMQEMMEILNKVFPKAIGTDPEMKYNPASGLDKKRLFHTFFHCKLIYKDGKITIDKNALEKYMEDKRPYVKLLAEATRRYRLSQTMYGKLKTPLLNGRMHTAYDVTGTDTGRISSKESIFGSGTNLQNLKKGVQREMLIPG